MEYTLLKSDCPSWWISKKCNEHTLEERYAIKFFFKLGGNATETYGMLQTAFGASSMNRASVFEWHKRFKEGREFLRDDERCGRSKEVNTPEFIGQRVRVTMLKFLGSSGRDSVGGAQHFSNRFIGISTRTIHQSTTPSLSLNIWPRWASRQFATLPISQTLLPLTFVYSISSEAVVMRQVTRWKSLWRRSMIGSHKRTSMNFLSVCMCGSVVLNLQISFFFVLWRKQQSANIHVCKNKINKFKKNTHLFGDRPILK